MGVCYGAESGPAGLELGTQGFRRWEYHANLMVVKCPFPRLFMAVGDGPSSIPLA